MNVRELTSAERQPPVIYDLCLAHGMVPANVSQALVVVRSLASAPEAYVVEDDGTEIATLFFTDVLDGESCYLGVILRPKAYANGDRKAIEATVAEIVQDAAKRHRARRITSTVPVLRARTKKLLRNAGFVIEGRMRDAWCAANKRPEDVYVMGYLPGD